MQYYDEIKEYIEGQGVAGREQIQQLFPDADLAELLPAMEENADVLLTRKRKYASLAQMDYVKGQLEIKRGGFGFVRDEKNGDVFIGASQLGGAFDGEMVLAKIVKTGGRNREGKVVRALSALPYRVTGTFEKSAKAAFVVCDNGTTPDVYIPRQGGNGAKNGQKVLLSITKRAIGSQAPEGKIEEVLGYPGQPGVDILSVARGFGLYAGFPEAVQKEADALGETVLKEDLKGRELLYDKRIFTIDGEHSKDFDDAVSIERAQNGNAILGVHIADVSHYVRKGTALDKEALARGTSVYLLDRVVPMLPEQLSNGLCSLNEGVVRLALSCFMEITPEGRVVSHRIGKTAIKSCHRLTYGQVNRMLEENDQELIAQYSDIIEDLRQMQELAQNMRALRFQKGSIDFEVGEAEIELNKAGKPVRIALREHRTAERLIEEFMVTCNNTVAEIFAQAELPFIYRIHETPDEERIRELSIFLSNFGYRLPAGEKLRSKTVQTVLEKSKGTSAENIINRVTLRSLKKARYSTENAGHFGLASGAYSHFTSPIRRYPDLAAHRVITDYIEGTMDYQRLEQLEKELVQISKHSSERERNAIDAERQVDAMKKAEYMQQFIGKSFDAVVSGVANTAIFVELENTVEGVIPLSEIRGDYFVYFKELYCVLGERTKKRINLGDKVKVKAKSADVEHARVEFSLISFPREERKEKSTEQKQRAGRKRNGRRNQNRRRQ